MHKGKSGAPRGGYVHWLLWSLPSEFKGAYRYEFYAQRIEDECYVRHNYVFYRMQGRRLYDVFVVVQTSEHYWHVTYSNLFYGDFEYFGDKKTSRLARRMWFIYKIDGRKHCGREET